MMTAAPPTRIRTRPAPTPTPTLSPRLPDDFVSLSLQEPPRLAWLLLVGFSQVEHSSLLQMSPPRSDTTELHSSPSPIYHHTKHADTGGTRIYPGTKLF